MTQDIFEKERREWEAKFPKQDYDEYIDGLVNEARDEPEPDPDNLPSN